MNKYYVLIIVFFVAGILGTMAYFSYQNSNPSSNKNGRNGTDLRYEEDANGSNPSSGDTAVNSVVSLNTKELAYGQFDGYDEKNIYLSTDEGRVSLPLSTTTYRILCTAQDLSSIKSVDFSQKTYSKRANTKDVVSLLVNGDTVVLFSNEDDNGTLVNHTAILEDANCPK